MKRGSTLDGPAALEPVIPDGGSSRGEGARLEVPAVVAFLVSYGAACVIASHLHYRLAYLYAVTFSDPKGASRPRVAEKFNQAFGADMTIGRLWGLVRERQPMSLRHTVDCAVDLRNYLVHLLIWETRALQASEAALETLSARLDVARDYLTMAGQALHDRHGEILLAAGATPEQLQSFTKPWDELGETAPLKVKVPAKVERIVRAWRAPNEVPGPRVYLENEAGDFWQLNENGLTECSHDARGADWVESSEIQAHLPANVTSRPSKKSNPRGWRSEFNYDLRFSTGVDLRLERTDSASDVVTLEVRPWKSGTRQAGERE